VGADVQRRTGVVVAMQVRGVKRRSDVGSLAVQRDDLVADEMQRAAPQIDRAARQAT
jgi:hypothetical protein